VGRCIESNGDLRQYLSIESPARAEAGRGGVAAVRKLIYVVLLVAFSLLVVYGIAAGDFDEVFSNGWML
jgi:hypothetical protein